MKNIHQFLHLTFVVITALGTLTACTNKPVPITQALDNPETAIKNFRAALGLPDLPLELKGADTMINSPGGDLDVLLFTDSDGRKFYVEPHSITVVEMDARDLLASIPANAPVFSQVEIKERVNKMLAAAIPGFETLSQSLTYEEGGKIDNYFFNWYGEQSPADFNRPFIQVGVYKTGFIFAYYNTVTFNK